MSLLSTESRAAVQRWTKEVRAVEVEPARRLMVAVLQDAVLTLIDPPSSRSAAARRQVLEAESWLHSNNRSHPFAFLTICEALDLEPGYLRRMVMRWRRENAS